jgi:Domain of unknown function (DUF6134)
MQTLSPSWIIRRAALILFLILVPVLAQAQSTYENVFASVSLDGKKIGQIHYTLKLTPTGEVEQIHTNTSVSVLGIKFYAFAQHLHESWQNGTLQTLRSDADDNGTDEKARVKRVADAYDAERNGTPVDLPATVFPDSIWHYAITKQSQIFGSVDLRLMKVSVTRADDTIDYHGKTVPAERFDFTGDWHAQLWFGKNKHLLKANRMIGDREIVITVDSDN